MADGALRGAPTAPARRCVSDARVDFGAAGESRELRGARAVVGQALFYGRLGLVIRPALVNGVAGAVTMLEGEVFSVGGITVSDGKIVAIDILADPKRLAVVDVAILEP